MALHIEDFANRGDQLDVVYLDHDPVVCAHYAVDNDLDQFIAAAAQHLSNAWHIISPDMAMVDWVAPAHHKEPALPHQIDWMRAEVLGQRILSMRYPTHAASQWAMSAGGNYWWLWRYAMALITTWNFLYKCPHPLCPVVFPLEVLPPPLLPTLNAATEAPVTMPVEYRVATPDGLYYEGVDSWRKWYRTRPLAVQRWKGRKRPEWF